MTYYKLYGTVEACFVEAVKACARLASRRIEERLAGVDGARPRAETGMQTLVDLLTEEPGLAQVLAVEARAGGVTSREAQLQWLDRLAKLFANTEGWSQRMAFSAVATLVALEVATGRVTELQGMQGELVDAGPRTCAGVQPTA